MSSVVRKPRLSAQDYFVLERAADWKHEYVDGEVREMAHPSRWHCIVTGNVAASLHDQLAARAEQVFASQMRVRISDTGAYLYPDVVVACGDIQFEDAEVDTLLNPTVVIEVLSPSTEAYDRGAKFGHYRTIPSVQEYVLIAQDRLSMQRYLRQGDAWLWVEVNRPGEVLELPSTGCQLPVDAVYEKVDFAEAEDTDETGNP
jgi:Uma2 family endonuclease